MLGPDTSDLVVLALSLRSLEELARVSSETRWPGALFTRRSDLWGREGPVGEPFETSEALLGVVGLGGRFICKGFMAEDEYWDVSIPGRAGRFDGKGGGWRDIMK
jgi:hypothetical protein